MICECGLLIILEKGRQKNAFARVMSEYSVLESVLTSNRDAASGIAATVASSLVKLTVVTVTHHGLSGC